MQAAIAPHGLCPPEKVSDDDEDDDDDDDGSDDEIFKCSCKKGGAACLPCIALLQLSMGGQVTNMNSARMCEISIFEKKIFKYLSIISLNSDLTHSMQIFAGEKY